MANGDHDKRKKPPGDRGRMRGGAAAKYTKKSSGPSHPAGKRTAAKKTAKKR